MQYNEDEVLTKYIWEHYQYLMTDFEREVGKAIIGREKARDALNEQHASMLNRQFGRIDREDINQALQQGEVQFRIKVRDRLLQDYRDQIYINRCSKCLHILRTPVARLCTWCGYNWIDSTNDSA